MRIHTDLPMNDIRALVNTMEDVYFTRLEQSGSRSRSHKFDVILTGTSNRPQNFGGEDKAATWDEWGQFIARVFDADPNAIVGQYRSLGHFEWSTEDRFKDGDALPGDTHQQHN